MSSPQHDRASRRTLRDNLARQIDLIGVPQLMSTERP